MGRNLAPNKGRRINRNNAEYERIFGMLRSIFYQLHDDRTEILRTSDIPTITFGWVNSDLLCRSIHITIFGDTLPTNVKLVAEIWYDDKIDGNKYRFDKIVADQVVGIDKIDIIAAFKSAYQKIIGCKKVDITDRRIIQ